MLIKRCVPGNASTIVWSFVPSGTQESAILLATSEFMMKLRPLVSKEKVNSLPQCSSGGSPAVGDDCSKISFLESFFGGGLASNWFSVCIASATRLSIGYSCCEDDLMGVQEKGRRYKVRGGPRTFDARVVGMRVCFAKEIARKAITDCKSKKDPRL